MRPLIPMIVLVFSFQFGFAQQPNEREFRFCIPKTTEKSSEDSIKIDLNQLRKDTHDSTLNSGSMSDINFRKLWAQFEHEIPDGIKIDEVEFSNQGVLYSGTRPVDFSYDGFRCVDFRLTERPSQSTFEGACFEPIDLRSSILGLSTIDSFEVHMNDLELAPKYTVSARKAPNDEFSPLIWDPLGRDQHDQSRNVFLLSQTLLESNSQKKSEEEIFFSGLFKKIETTLKESEESLQQPPPSAEELQRRIFHEDLATLQQSMAAEGSFTPSFTLGDRGANSRIGSGFVTRPGGIDTIFGRVAPQFELTSGMETDATTERQSIYCGGGIRLNEAFGFRVDGAQQGVSCTVGGILRF